MLHQEQQSRRLNLKFWIFFLLWTSALVLLGYLVIWAEIEKIRALVPEANRDDTDSCYNNPLLNMQIWTKESHFYPMYKMQDVAAYARCLETEDALNMAQIFYVSYYIVSLTLVMGFFVFLFEITGFGLKYGFQLVLLPILFGTGESVFIFYLLESYERDGIGGLDETLCQLCSCVGLIFWVLFAFVVLLVIIGFLSMSLVLCSGDQQQGVTMVTVRDQDKNDIFNGSTYEMMGQKKRSGF